MKTSTCSVCGKPLSDPVSVEVGMGPVCRVNKKLQDRGNKTGNIFSNRAEYEWDIILGENGKPDVIWIKDSGGLKSVTNDIENILEDISKELAVPGSILAAKIMYQDSMAIWDGIKILFHSPFKVEFFPLTEKEFSKAKKKLLSSR